MAKIHEHPSRLSSATRALLGTAFLSVCAVTGAQITHAASGLTSLKGVDQAATGAGATKKAVPPHRVAMHTPRRNTPAPKAQQEATRIAQAGVRAAIDESIIGWNTGNLDRFMGVYAQGPDTLYVSGDKIMRGYEAISANYAPRLASPANVRGVLTLEFVDFRLLGPDHAFLLGRFRLVKPGEADATGLTTLLFQRTHAGWRIIADHS